MIQLKEQADELARAEARLEQDRAALERSAQELASSELEIEETRLDLSEMFGQIQKVALDLTQV